jgi:hypothetical protein
VLETASASGRHPRPIAAYRNITYNVVGIINKQTAIGYRFDQFRYGPDRKFARRYQPNIAARSRAVVDSAVISMGEAFPASSRPLAMGFISLRFGEK